MDGLLSFLLFAGLFYLMMRYGCGAHMIHGHSNRADKPSKFIDPVCGMEINANQGYSKIHEGVPYRFCSRSCLDKFDKAPRKFLKPDVAGESQ